MDTLSKEELRTLLDEQTAPCVSLYMPMHKSMPDAMQNPVRFKNLLHEAERQLKENGFATRANGMLDDAKALLNDMDHWRHPEAGMAAFISPAGFKHYRLPVAFGELVVVTERFHTKPLLPLLTGDGKFYVLAMSQNDVRVLECTRDSSRFIDVEKMPRNRKEALNEQTEKQTQFHSIASQSPGERVGMFHGHGSSTDESKDFLLRYCREIDRALYEQIKNERAPLVVAAVDYLHPIYREANTYPHLLEAGVNGNPELWNEDELRKLAWTAAEPHFRKAQEESLGHYRANLKGSPRASNRVRIIIPAAHYGRVDTLFVAEGEQVWGKYDSQNERVEVHPEQASGDVDLLDLAATDTILNAGVVYVIRPEEMPDGATVAAIFRY